MVSRSISTSPAKICVVILLSIMAALAVHTGATAELAKGDLSRSEALARPPGHDRQIVTIWVHGEDIYPGVVRVRPGRVLIRAENETQSDIVLVVERIAPGAAPQAAATVSTSRRAKRADKELQLGAGEYRFYEQSQPDTMGAMIVEPR